MDFHGSLTEFQLPDIIQFLSGAQKTGRLSLEGEEHSGTIYLQNGVIVHGECGDAVGEEAIYSLVLLSQGQFQFDPEISTETVSISRSNTSLLMEAVRRHDEWRVISEKVPSVDWIPEFVIPEGGETGQQITLNTSEWIILSKIDGKRSLREIAMASSLSTFHTCRLLFSLISTRLILLHPPDPNDTGP